MARDSITGALAVADHSGLPDLAQLAADAFVDGLTQASLVGGIILVLAAALTFALVPRTFDLTAPPEH